MNNDNKIIINLCKTIQTIKNSFSRSRGAVNVLDTAPAAAPDTRWRHQMPVCSSVSVKSSGTVAGSPTSIIYNHTHTSLLSESIQQRNVGNF